MATWGPTRRRSKSASGSRSRAGSSTKAAARTGTKAASKAPAKSAASSASRRTRTGTSRGEASIDPTIAIGDPDRPRSRRSQASDDIRDAVQGRENEFWGIGLIAAGVLIGLAIYFKMAGPLGEGIDALFAWIAGIGRYLVPIALIGIGAALIHKDRSANRFRLAIGMGLAAWAMLGLLHVARTTGADFDNREAGGWLGLAIGGPLRGLISSAGAIVALLAIILLGAMLITGMSLRTLVSSTSRGISGMARPMGRKARQVLDDMSTLKSERADGAATGELPAPRIYDAADDFDDAPAKKPRRPRSPSPSELVGGPGEQQELALGPGAKRGQWTLPPANLLSRSPAQTINKAEVEARGKTLIESLNSHGVDTTLIGQTVGPTVTRYELELGSGVKVARVTNLNRDIAYAMAATDVRILAPIPGRSAIGVEVPNHTRQLVALGDIMASPEAKNADHPLDVAVGKDIAGRSVFLNLATTPHLLIAGTTGSGKSSGINCILTSMLMRTTPDQVRLILIDPKQVEMGQYNRLPHLLTAPVTNPKKAANALSWAVKEMERRYDVLTEVGYRDITGYNAAYDRGELEQNDPFAAPPLPDEVDEPVASDEPVVERYPRLPYIVVVVDELNDLMMVAARDVEESITRIAQKARAVGIHLIVATQRPSVNVITGVIKANVPARMAFAVSSLTDSRVILDQPGAEKLVGKGDMLLLPGTTSVSQRIQGCFVAEEEIRKVVAHWKRQGPEPQYVSGVEGGDEGGGGGGLGAQITAGSSDEDEDDVLMRQAMELVVRSQLGSTSMLQRKLKIGFARAGRVMDLLEQRGVVGPSEGSKARAVLMPVEVFELTQEGEGR